MEGSRRHFLSRAKILNRGVRICFSSVPAAPRVGDKCSYYSFRHSAVCTTKRAMPAVRPLSFYKRAVFLTLSLFVLHAALVATHRGEFWPFSIYPMFSTGAADWQKVVVREVSSDARDVMASNLGALPGRSFPLEDQDLSEHDLSNLVARTESWTSERREVLRRFFSTVDLEERTLLLIAVQPVIEGGNRVAFQTVPLLLVDADSVRSVSSVDPESP